MIMQYIRITFHHIMCESGVQYPMLEISSPVIHATNGIPDTFSNWSVHLNYFSAPQKNFGVMDSVFFLFFWCFFIELFLLSALESEFVRHSRQEWPLMWHSWHLTSALDGSTFLFMVNAVVCFFSAILDASAISRVFTHHTSNIMVLADNRLDTSEFHTVFFGSPDSIALWFSCFQAVFMLSTSRVVFR